MQASYGVRHRDVGGAAGEYYFGLFLEVPIFAGRSVDGQVNRMEARQEQVEAARDAFEAQLHVDIRGALTGWRIALASAQFATKAVQVNREALDAAKTYFESGKATALDILTSQTELVRAEAANVQALGDVAIARAKLTDGTDRVLLVRDVRAERVTVEIGAVGQGRILVSQGLSAGHRVLIPPETAKSRAAPEPPRPRRAPHLPRAPCAPLGRVELHYGAPLA